MFEPAYTIKEKKVADNLTIESRIRSILKMSTEDEKMKFDGKFFDALDVHVRGLVLKAAYRAKTNGRVTLRPEDI
jgi:cytochrome c